MNRLLLFLSILLLMSSSCYFESDSIILDETTEKYQLYDYYVDDCGNEGIVAFIASNGIIVLSADESYEAWGPMETLVYQSDTISTEILDSNRFGLAMLQSMKAFGIERFPAQAWCDSKNKQDEYPYSGSWRLPSYNELGLIFGQGGSKVEELNKALYSIGGTLIDKEEMLWTCVEDFDHYIVFSNHDSDYDKVNRAVITTPTERAFLDKDRWIKKNKHIVRAIKYIYYKR